MPSACPTQCDSADLGLLTPPCPVELLNVLSVLALWLRTQVLEKAVFHPAEPNSPSLACSAGCAAQDVPTGLGLLEQHSVQEVSPRRPPESQNPVCRHFQILLTTVL